MSHTLDHAVWTALRGRQAHLALGGPRAFRFEPGHAAFAAMADNTAETRAEFAGLIAAHGEVIMLQPEPVTPPPGTVLVLEGHAVQMIAHELTPGPTTAPAFEVIPLTDADGPEMLALASLTKPGPFFVRTHRLGDFVGVKEDGRLIAMAGERLKPEGFTEVSGVCTHPDARGRGLGGVLTRIVAERIVARGETPFLHSYADNAGAIALYEALGFSIRVDIAVTVLAPG